MNNSVNIINHIKAFSGLVAFVSEGEGQAMLDHFMRCYERGQLMEPKLVLNMLLQEFQRQDPLHCWEEKRTICYALRRWVAVMAGQGKGYREIANIQPTNDYERLYVDAAKLVVAENYENMGFEVSFKHACHMLDKINSETADSLCVAVADGLNDRIDEFGLTADDWDAVERLREFYERLLSNHFPEVDVEAVIGEMDFNLHPSIIIHLHQGYKKMAAFHFCLDRNRKTISGYILAFKKVKQ